MTSYRKWDKIKIKTWEHARDLRKNLTPAERLLWTKLCSNQTGAAFRKQHPIGPFIVDFCSKERKIVVELDGDSHGLDGAPEYDEQRTAYLEEQGWKVIRYTNRDVMNNLDNVVKDIIKHLEQELRRE